MTQHSDDWIEWEGGSCPVRPTAEVVIRCRDGYETKKPLRAIQLTWDHGEPRGQDIIAYRLVKP
jgi:hypothetical protein